VGKVALRDYFAAALERYPDLRFEPLGLFAGVDSLVLHYVSVGGRAAAETVFLDEDDRVTRYFAHYVAEPESGNVRGRHPGRRMKTTELSPTLIQLTRFRFVNAYLVREDDGFTLVDTTLGGAADGLLAAAAQAGGTIRRIALTHGHGDHVGSLDAL